MDSKRALLYLPFTSPAGTPMVENGLVRAWDGQYLKTTREPQLRHGKMWTKHGGWGLEIANDMSADLWSDHLAENVDRDSTSPCCGWGSYNANYEYGNEAWAASLFGRGKAMRLWTTATDTNHGIYANTVAPGDTISFYALGSDWDNISIYTNVSGFTSSKTQVGTFNGEPVYRIHATKTTATGAIWFRPNNNNGDFDCWICGWQKETNADDCSPVNTAGAARNNQSLIVPAAGNWPGWDSGSFIISFRPDWKYDNPPAWPKLLSFYDGTNHWYVQYSTSGYSWNVTWGGGSLNIASTHARGDKIFLILTWDGINKSLAVNGSTFTTSAIGTTTKYPFNEFAIGSNYAGSGQCINGVIGEVAMLNHYVNQDAADKLYEAFSNGKTLRDYIL